MTKDVLEDEIHIYCTPYLTPVVEARRGSGAITISIVSGAHSVDEASEIAEAITKAAKFAAKEDRDDEKEGD